MRGKLFAPVDGASLAAFRFLFGLFMAASAFSKYVPGVEKNYAYGRFHFSYPGFDWVHPAPGWGMEIEAVLMGVAGFALMVGYHARLAAFLHFVLYTHIFLVEASQFNNHYYLIVLLSLLFIAVDSSAALSYDRERRPPQRRDWIPAWQLYLFRAQMVIVYFFGGIAKLNADWLRGEPMREWLRERSILPVVGDLLLHPFAPYFFSYSGILFDLSIGFLLLWRRTRLIALVPLVFFHVTNSVIFSIGIFPWLALATTILFFPPSLPRRMLEALKLLEPQGTHTSVYAPVYGLVYKRAVVGLLLLYLGLQCLLPLRHFMYPGNSSWNEFGHNSSWHMKLRDKLGALGYVVEDPRTGQFIIVDEAALRSELTERQVEALVKLPDLILQYGQELARRYEAEHGVRPRVYAETLVSLNGRPFVPLVRADADLAEVDHPMLEHQAWLASLDVNLPLGVYPSHEEAKQQVLARLAAKAHGQGPRP